MQKRRAALFAALFVCASAGVVQAKGVSVTRVRLAERASFGEMQHATPNPYGTASFSEVHKPVLGTGCLVYTAHRTALEVRAPPTTSSPITHDWSMSHNTGPTPYT